MYVTIPAVIILRYYNNGKSDNQEEDIYWTFRKLVYNKMYKWGNDLQINSLSLSHSLSDKSLDI